MKNILIILAMMFSAQALAYDNCKRGEWYSVKQDRCFKKYGVCKQYNFTNEKTCENRKDDLSCEWKSRKQKCKPKNEVKTCGYDEWYSAEYNECYKKVGRCSQYNDTDSRTCNSGNDRMMCDWNSKRRTCYSESKGRYCKSNEWKSITTGRCFKKYGRCKQYDGTNKLVCNSPKDNMMCDWDSRTDTCYPER